MFQRDPITFNRLKALSMRKRMDVARSPDVGAGLLSALTPTDLASLFPDYYKRILPNVEGFRRAISAQSAKESAVAAGKLEERLSAVEGKTASIMVPVSQRSKMAAAPAQLSPEQAAAFQKLQQGNIGVNSPDAKFFSNLSTSQLASIGISKTKDNTGADVYQYSAPEVSREEAVARLKGGAKGNFAQRASAFMSRLQNDLGVTKAQAAGMLGSLGAETGGLRAINEERPVVPGSRGGFGWAQWTGPRRKEFEAFAASKGLDIRSDEANYQFFVHELRTTESKALSQVKRTETVEEAARTFTGSEATGTGYLRPRIEHYDPSIRYAHQAFSGTPSPAGVTGEYTEDQINKMMEQLKTEKNEQRRQELAAMIGSAGGQAAQDSTAAVTGKVTYGQVKDFSQYILHSEPGHKQCGQGTRILAGHMYGHDSFISDGLKVGGSANAGSLSQGNNYFQRSGLFNQPKHVSEGAVKNQAFLDSLPIGTVVSATKSGAAGHVQIKIGPGQWASDFKQQHFISNGYSNFTVHMPNESGLQALKRNGVDQSVTAIAGDEDKVQISPTPRQVAGEPPEAPAVAPPATPASYNPDAGDTEKGDPGGPAPTATVQPPAGSDFQPQSEQLSQQAVKDIQQAPPPAPKSSSGTYAVNMKAFREAVKNDPSNSYPGWMIDMASDQDIIDGFNKDARVMAAGVKIGPDGKMTVKDVNNPDVKSVIEGAQKGGALKLIEEQKKEAPKPKQQAEAPKEMPKQVPQQPTADVSKPESVRAGEPPQAPPVAPPEPAPKQVQGYSDGGSFDMKSDTLNLYKVDKQDDMVAINPQTQQPVATLKSGEGITSGDSRVDVTPQERMNDARPEPNPLSSMVQKVSSLENTMQTAIELANRPTTKIEQMSPDTQTNHANLIGDTNRAIVNQQKFSPSYDRAMNRIANMTEPAGYNQHYSYGNK